MGRRKGSLNKKPRKEKKVRITKKDRQRSAKSKHVETLQSLDFGLSGNQCYRASVIKIDGEPYCGIIKCWRVPMSEKFNYSRTRVFLPMPAWNSFINDVVPQIKYPPTLQRQLGMTEDSNEYVSI